MRRRRPPYNTNPRPAFGISQKEIARIVAFHNGTLEERAELFVLWHERQINSRAARQLYQARDLEFRIWAVRKMRDERDVYRVAVESPDVLVRKEAIERLRFTVSLKRLLRHEQNQWLLERIRTRYDWLTRRQAEVLALKRAMHKQAASGT